MKVVGFDFGTTNSLISSIQGGRAINYLDHEGLPIPSVVCYEGASTIVGREAKERLAEAGLGIKGNVIRSPKFLLGKQSVFVEGVEKNPVDIVSDVVSFVAKLAQERRGSDLESVDRAVVTIPVDMEGYKRAALRDAFRSAGISIVQFVHEPLAALYGFFRMQPDLAQALRQYDRQLILVFDWGGGTLDLTLCQLADGMLVQIRNDGTDEVGGDAFDEILRNEVVKRVMEARGYDENIEHYPDALARLLHRCERAKIDLSSRKKNVELYVDSFFRGVDDDGLNYSLTREGLEEIVSRLLDKGLKRIQKLLESADVSAAQIAACIATGGMANMPAIKSRLHEWFGAQRVHVSDRSGTLIAEGSAWIAHDEVQLHLAKNVELLLARNSHMTLVPSGTAMPTEGEVMKDEFHLYCADPRDGHAKFQIEAPIRAGKKVLPNETRNPLSILVIPVDAKARPFRERLELDVRIDDNLIFQATARSLNVKGIDYKEVHQLEFGLLFPLQRLESSESIDQDLLNKEGSQLEPKSLVMRSNLARTSDDFFVPGELLYTYKPEYFDRRLDPPEIQVEEKLYYDPCSICGRISNDPMCQCARLLRY